MKIITINLPQKYLDCIEILIRLGYYPSRSETIRVALREFLGDELTMYQRLDKESFAKLKKTQLNSMIAL